MAIFLDAISATAAKRMSIAALEDKNKILLQTQSDAVMRQRWVRYCIENYYANGIEFDEVIEVIEGLLQTR